MASPNVLLQGQLHRLRYEGGGVLKCLLYAECADHAGPSIRIQRLATQVVGMCTIDTNRITCPRGMFGDEVMGEGQLHSVAGAAPSSASRSPPPAPSPAAAKGGVWGLLGWGRRASSSLADESGSSSAIERSESLPSLNSSALLFPIASSYGGHSSSAAASKSDETHVIFSSPIVAIVEDTVLRPADTCVAAFRCDLPPNLPPTYSGFCARYHYAVHALCEYRVEGGGSVGVGGAAVLTRTLRIPVRVDSMSATYVMARSPYVPTAINTAPYGSASATTASADAFDFKPQHTFIVSSLKDALRLQSGMAPPLSDAIQYEPKRDAKAAGSSSLSCYSSTKQLGAASKARPAPQPWEVGVPAPAVGGAGLSPMPVQIKANSAEAERFPVRILLWDTCVRVGDTVRGLFRCCLPASPAPLVCFRAALSLECLEAAPKSLFRTGSVLPKESEDEFSYIVAHCSTVEESEHYLSFSASQVPFTIPLTNARCQQSSRTDIVSHQWRLRVVLYFSAASSVAEALTAKGDASLVPIIERLQEVVIPLTILPPAPVARLGAVISSE